MVKVSPNHLTRVKNVFLNGFIELCPKMRIARRGKIPRRKLIFKLLRSEISLPKVHTWMLESGNKRVTF